jgi:hypothetical protein
MRVAARRSGACRLLQPSLGDLQRGGAVMKDTHGLQRGDVIEGLAPVAGARLRGALLARSARAAAGSGEPRRRGGAGPRRRRIEGVHTGGGARAPVTPVTARTTHASVQGSGIAWFRGDRGWVGYLRRCAMVDPPPRAHVGAPHAGAAARRAAASRGALACVVCEGAVGAREAESEPMPMTTRSWGPEARSAVAHVERRHRRRASREGQP